MPGLTNDASTYEAFLVHKLAIVFIDIVPTHKGTKALLELYFECQFIHRLVRGIYQLIAPSALRS